MNLLVQGRRTRFRESGKSFRFTGWPRFCHCPGHLHDGATQVALTATVILKVYLSLEINFVIVEIRGKIFLFLSSCAKLRNDITKSIIISDKMWNVYSCKVTAHQQRHGSNNVLILLQKSFCYI